MFPDDEPVNYEITSAVDTAVKEIDYLNRNPFVQEIFTEEKLFTALPDSVQNDPHELAMYIENTGKLNNILARERNKKNGELGLFAENVDIPETQHATGDTRRAESGYRINIDYLRSVGIDPSKVLMFRVTQPSDQPKPEYYWTTDYFETQRGLTVEISPEKRHTAITLVADMQTVAGDQGLIQDMNDDNGLAVRQIDQASFDQKNALAIIK